MPLGSLLMHRHRKNDLRNIILEKQEKRRNEGPQREQHDCSFANEKEKRSETHLKFILIGVLSL